MRDDELRKKVRGAMHRQRKDRGYASAVDVLMDIGVLSKAKYEDWRFGRVDYLERACALNLRKLSLVLREMASYAKECGLKPSYCCYKQWGVKKKFGQKRPVIQLRFSKSGDLNVERAYATHYVDNARVEELKAQKSSVIQEKGTTQEG